jgi:hypothetical protein
MSIEQAPTAVEDRGLPISFRPIRRIEPPGAPWPAILVRDHAARSRMLVDADRLRGWTGWNAASDGHVLGPDDVHRRRDGHDVALPLCTETLDALLERRAAASDALSGGEVVTLVVSIMRGIDELRRTVRGGVHEAHGRWWLSDTGRPVFVGGEGPAATTEAERLLLVALDGRADLEPILRLCLDAVRAPRAVPRELAEIEAALFAFAAAAPLATSRLAPARIPGHSASVPTDRSTVSPASPRPWSAMLGDLIDARPRRIIAELLTRLRRAPRGESPRRRRPIILAAAAGAVVLVGGLLWPTSSGDPASADGVRRPSAAAASLPTRTATPPVAPTPRASTGAHAGAPDRLEVVAADLLDARRACHAQTSCLADVQEDPAQPLAAGSADLPSADLTITLLDEYGGAAVLKAQPRADRGPARYVVIIREKDRWLLRDVYDVAQQPSG